MTTPKKTDTARRTPRPRAAADQKKAPADWFGEQQAGYLERATAWLRTRPGRRVDLPAQVNLVVALGVPCPDCKKVIHHDGEDGHTAQWQRVTGAPHWASGITVSCKP